MSVDNITIKPKRGRRSKKEIEAAKLQNEIMTNNNVNNILDTTVCQNIDLKINCCNEIKELKGIENDNVENETEIEDENIIVKHGAKKRGRKPKGGKIIQQTLPIEVQKENKPNIILHLKCSLKDLSTSGDYNSNFTNANVDPYNFETKNEFTYEVFNNTTSNSNSNSNSVINNNLIDSNNKIYAFTNNNINSNENIVNNGNMNNESDDVNCSVETREIWRKLKILEKDLHVNNISDKKSACFWCSHDFDNPPIYIPKHFIKDSYNVYGCFCTPECAVAHLMEENIDSSAKFERYQLINHIYSKIYEYKKNIKPAPNPHYMLDKYYGNLSIQEYRLLLRSERLFLIVDKPLTRILPEFHEDNDDFIINNKIIPSNNYQVKKRLQKKVPQTKNNIMNEKFGIPNVL